MSEKGKEDSAGMSTRKSPRGSGLQGSSPVTVLGTNEPEKKYMTTRAKTDPEAAARKRQSITSMFKAPNVTKAEDGGLIYRRRSSIGEPSKKKAATTVASRMRTGTVVKPERVSPVRPESPIQHERPAPPMRRKRSIADESPNKDTKKKRQSRTMSEGEDGESDFYCWQCHKEGHVICCELCPRVYHAKCLGVEKEPSGEWVCPECEKIMRAECEDTKSKSMSMVTVNQLCVLLNYALLRMKCQGSEPFQKAVDLALVPEYSEYVFNPMDLSVLEKNIKKKQYGSTEAFLADSKWILHNCIVFNGAHHKLTAVAKSIIKICQHEMSEIEICADCYYNSCTKQNENWFCEPCVSIHQNLRVPHPLVWAKMKGYPFWPAKALREVNGQVDARFFGEHDRAWVPVNQVYLLSKDPPTAMKTGRKGFDESMEELQLHIDKIKEKFGSFEFAPFRTPYDLKNPYMPGKVKTPTRESPASPTTSPNLKRKFIEKAPKSATSKSASAVKMKYSLKRKIIVARKPSDNNESFKSANSGTDGDLIDENSDNVLEHVSDDNMLLQDNDLENSGDEKNDENSDKDTMEYTLSPSTSKASGIFAASESREKTPSPLEPPQLSQVEAPSVKVGSNLSIINKLGKKLAEWEKAQEESDSVKSDSREKDNDETDNTQIESTSSTEKDDAKVESDGEILKEILEKARLFEKESESSDTKVDTSAKPNPFLRTLIESCKEKLKVSEEDLMADSSTKNKSEGEDSDSNSSSSSDSSSDSDSDTEVDEASHQEGKNEENDSRDQDQEGKEMVVDDKKSEEPSATNKSTANSKIEDEHSEINKEKAVESKEKEMEVDQDESQAVQDNDNDQSTEVVKSDLQPSVKLVQTKEEQQRLAELAHSLNDEKDQENTEDQASSVLPQTSSSKPLPHSPAALKPTTAITATSPRSLLASSAAKLNSQKAAVPIGRIMTVGGSSQQAVSILKQIQKSIPAKSTDIVSQSTEDKDASEKLPENNSEQSRKKEVTPHDIEAQPNTDKKNDDASKKSTSSTALQKDDKRPDHIIASVGGHQEKITLDFTGFDVKETANRMMDTIQDTMQDMCRQVLVQQASSVMQARLQLELDRMKWKQEQEILEIKHNMSVNVAEMRHSLETARDILLQEQEKKWKEKMEKAVEETKKKQWCANCGKEAIFYCCWNTSYCDYPCQQSHWPKHMTICTQGESHAKAANQENVSEKVQQVRHEFEQAIQRHQASNQQSSPYNIGPQAPFSPGGPMMLQMRPGLQPRPPRMPGQAFMRGNVYGQNPY